MINFNDIQAGTQIHVVHKHGDKFTLTSLFKYNNESKLRLTYTDKRGVVSEINYSVDEITKFINLNVWVEYNMTHPHSVVLPEELFTI